MALDRYDRLAFMDEMTRAQRLSPKVFEDRISKELVWNLKVIGDALQTIARQFEAEEEAEE